jgi:CBS-domain-containing membrane protein
LTVPNALAAALSGAIDSSSIVITAGLAEIAIVENSAVVGILTRADLLTALARQEQQSPVADVMRRNFLTADAADMIDVAFQRLQEHECHTIPVVRGGRLIGLLTMDNMGEFLRVQAAIGGRRAAHRRSASIGRRSA